MNKRDIILKASMNGGIPQSTVTKCINLFLEAVKDTLKEGESITIKNFGTFDVVEKKEKDYKNPKTGVRSVLPVRKAIRFKSNKNIVR